MLLLQFDDGDDDDDVVGEAHVSRDIHVAGVVRRCHALRTRLLAQPLHLPLPWNLLRFRPV